MIVGDIERLLRRSLVEQAPFLELAALLEDGTIATTDGKQATRNHNLSWFG